MDTHNNSLALQKQQFESSLVEVKTPQDALQLVAANEPWPVPAPIRSELLPVAKFSPDLLPAAFRAYVVDVSHRMQCPPDFIAVALMVVTSTLVGTTCRMRPKKNDDWPVVVNLWGAIVGKPGVLKTPALSEVLSFLSVLEAKEIDRHKKQVTEFELDQEVYDARRSALKEKLKSAAKGSDENEIEGCKRDFGLLLEPAKPVCKRVRTNDATIEKIGELLRDNSRGLLLYRDELMGLFSSWDREDRAADRAFFLEAWNGDGKYTTDRIGRGTIFIENLCLSLLGGIQPSKLVPYLYQATRGNNNDGLVQRLQLLVYPDDVSDWKMVDKAPDLAARRKVQDILGFLSNCEDYSCFGAQAESEGAPQYMRFSEDAQELFYDWMKRLECEKLRVDDEEPVLLEHFGKYRSLMPGLALLLHLIEETDSEGTPLGSVSAEATQRAIAWCDYLETHARRVYGLVSGINQKATGKLASMIRKGKLSDGFTVRDVYRNGWQFLTEKDVALDAIEALVDFGWLREVPSVREASRGRPAAPGYLINPAVKK